MMKVETEDGAKAAVAVPPGNKHPPMSTDGVMNADSEFTIEAKGTTVTPGSANGFEPSPPGGSDSSLGGGSSIDSGMGNGTSAMGNDNFSAFSTASAPMIIPDAISTTNSGFNFANSPSFAFQQGDNGLNHLSMMGYNNNHLESHPSQPQQQQFPSYFSPGPSGSPHSGPPPSPSTSAASGHVGVGGVGGSMPGTIKVASNLMPSQFDSPFGQVPMDPSDPNQHQQHQPQPQISVTVPMPYPMQQNQPPTFVTAGGAPGGSVVASAPSTSGQPTRQMMGRPMTRRMPSGRPLPMGAMRGGPTRMRGSRLMSSRGGLMRRPPILPSPSSSSVGGGGSGDDDIEIISESVTSFPSPAASSSLVDPNSGGGGPQPQRMGPSGQIRTPEKPRGGFPLGARRSPAGRLMRPMMRGRGGGLGRGAMGGVGGGGPGGSTLPSALQSRGISVTSNRRPMGVDGVGGHLGGGIKRRLESDGPVVCQICEQRFSSKQELQDHLVMIHAGGTEPFSVVAFNLHNINHINHLRRIGVEHVVVDKSGKRALPVFKLSDVRSGVSFEGITGLQSFSLS